MEYDYYLKQAVKFTNEIGLSSKGIELCPLGTYSINEIGFNVLNELYVNRKLTVGDLALQCFRSSILVHHYLRNELGISSIITTGSLTRSGKDFFLESKDTIKSRLENTLVEYPKPKFHTWLTIDRYIFDVTLYPTEWYLDQKSGENQDKNTKDYEQVFINSIFKNEKDCFHYKPILIGEDYFNKVRFLQTTDVL